LFYRYAGLYCVVLTGYAKGKDFKPGDSFKGESNHSWNAVYIDDNWHLVDTKWASITHSNNNSSVSCVVLYSVTTSYNAITVYVWVLNISLLNHHGFL